MNIGVEIDDDSNELAKEVIVLIIICINGIVPGNSSWVFFYKWLNGDQNWSIVKQ